MLTSDYIEVGVTLPVRGTFVYRIPKALKATAGLGMRVLVPFGRRRVTGYILDERADSGPYTAREVISVLDTHPLFPVTDIPFFKWISDYYIHPLGETIKTALPKGLEQKDVSWVIATEKGRKAMTADIFSEKEMALMTLAAQKTGCALKTLTRDGAYPAGMIRRLEKKGYIDITAVLKKGHTGIKKESFFSISPELPSTSIIMSKKRSTILAIVRDAGDISLTRLKSKVPTAPRLTRPLVDAGYLNVTERLVFRDPLGDLVEPDTPSRLTDEQAAVVKRVQQNWHRGFIPYLLTGVTGSGKTEVYMRLAGEAVKKGRGAIVLVPEIALISQTERRFRARFGNKIAVIHSMLTQGERLDQWRRIALGKVNIVIGARSALFAPLKDIGIIIVDEEHDSSYKQESGLRYNARDLAVVRAKMHHCPAVLGSATPSVQSYQNVTAKRFEQLELTKRINNHPLPKITLVDMKKYQDVWGTDRVITPELGRAIRDCLEKGHQALIFLNRRGFATVPACGSCAKILHCPHCDVTMTFHKGADTYKCHLCGHTFAGNIRCPACNTGKIRHNGFGTEKVETMLKQLFPDARLARMDQDSTAKKGSALKLLRQIRNRNVDIIVGTQMLAKGHDFPSITLVGVICADLSLSLPDFRASERTFQLLAQVAGRAGRGNEPGKVIMQTYNPDHFTIESSKKQDYLAFFNQEVPFRKALMYPPFTRMIQLKISGKNEQKTAAHAHTIAKVLDRLNVSDPRVQILGPTEAVIRKISSRFRWQILVKSVSARQINTMVSTMAEDPEITRVKTVTVGIDVDPYFLM
ncbi:MAG: primosomal protein N' [Desulfobacterales bacterium]|nr:MAG: primosomal protein N' [Desulfobacterales bacterium]